MTMNKRIETVDVISVGDGLFEDLVRPFLERGYTIHSMDRRGVRYQARRIVESSGPGEAAERRAA